MNQVPLTPQLSRGKRHLLWWLVGGLLFVASLLVAPRAWAQNVLCYANITIPTTPQVIYAVQGVSQTYGLSLCTNPAAPVTVTPVLSPTGYIDVTPVVLTFQTAVTQTVAVSLSNDVALTDLFTVTIRHNVASDDPIFNWGTFGAPTVLVIYDGPLAVNDAAATVQSAPATINVLQNDHDRSATGLQVVSVAQPAQGAATVNADNSITFTPTVAFTGTATFAYTMRDGRGNHDAADVFVQVTPSGGNTGVPVVADVDPDVDNTVAFTVTEATPATITVDLPAGFFDGALGPRDVLYIALTPIITPSNNVPPAGAYFIGVNYFLGIYLNDVMLDIAALAEPITVTIAYGATVDRARTAPTAVVSSPSLYYLDGGVWTQEGIEVLENDAQLQRLVIRTQVINREFTVTNATILRLPIIARQ